MQSRMGKYYRKAIDNEESSRVRRNEDAYDKLYNVDNYNPNNNISVIDNTNEIDINKIKELIKSRED